MTRWKPGDEVVIHCNQSCGECAECNGLDPMACSRQQIWAYETNWGSFAEYCLVQAQQLLPKPPRLTWEEAASYGLTYFTAYRMLVDRAGGRRPATTCSCGAPAAAWARSPSSCARSTGPTRSPSCRRDDKIDLVRDSGRAAVSTGASSRWPIPTPASATSTRSSASARPSASSPAAWTADIVFEHVGAATFFTRVFVCKTFGTIVICGATSGFQLDFDVRYLWMRQKTIIGSHFANAYECQRANQLIAEGKIEPVLVAGVPAGRSARCRTR